MTGETDSGITFGATIRADNAQGGEGGDEGQNEGSVFVSGSWGTLTYGDTNAADEQWVGDVPGDYSLTGLGELDETVFVSNGGSFGNDGGNGFADNPFARPTVRYDFDIMGFGLSVSSNRDLTDVGVGTGYAADFGGGSWSAGIGYYKFDSFDVIGDPTFAEVDVCIDIDENGDCIFGTAIVEVAPVAENFPDGETWSVGLNADYEAFGFGLTYIKLNSDTAAIGEFDADNILVGASFGWDAWAFGLVYGNILSAEGGLDSLDGASSWEASAQYDLGGGATVNGGVRQTYDTLCLGDSDDDDDVTCGDSATIADFGIKMAF